MHREIQIKPFPIVTTHWWPKTQNERFVWENEQYLYCFLPLVHNHVQVIWVRTRIRCVTCVCVRALWLMPHSHGASASTLDGGRVWSVVLTRRHSYNNQSLLLWCCMNGIGYLHEAIWLADASVGQKLRQHHASDTPSVKRWRRRPVWMQREPERTHTHVTHRMRVRTQITWTWLCTRGKNDINTVRFLTHKPLVSCLRPSMCSYDGELFNLDFSVHVLFPSYRDSDLYLPLYDWQTRTVWPKNIKIGSTEEKKTPTSWMPLG